MPHAKVVARFQDGRTLKGTTWNFWPNAKEFHVATHEPTAPGPVPVAMDELKAVFIVRDFAGDAQRRAADDPDWGATAGVRLKVTFRDGEVLEGSSANYIPGTSGFFLFPRDATSNNLRVFVVTASVQSVEEIAA